LIDTIAMIGSPASRGAVSSLTVAECSGLAAAPGLEAASAAAATSVTRAGIRLRRIATLDRAVANCLAIAMPDWMQFASNECQISG
jgi:hypothetical protein